MNLGVLLGRFFAGGVVCWVVAVLLAVGGFFGLWSWRRWWTVAGALAGAGTFALFVASQSMTVAYMQPVAGLFVGCGIAVAYGTLFGLPGVGAVGLEAGGAEGRLRILDAIDRLRPQRLDWMLTAALAMPGIALAWMGARRLFEVAPIVVGALSLLGPAWVGGVLALRGTRAREILAELETGEGAEGGAGPLSAIPPSASVRAPTRSD